MPKTKRQTRRRVQRAEQTPWTTERINRLSKLWKGGLDVDFIADQMGLKVTTIRHTIWMLRQEYPSKFPYRYEKTT